MVVVNGSTTMEQREVLSPAWSDFGHYQPSSQHPTQLVELLVTTMESYDRIARANKVQRKTSFRSIVVIIVGILLSVIAVTALAVSIYAVVGITHTTTVATTTIQSNESKLL